MFLHQIMNEKRIAGCIWVSLGSANYVNQPVYVALYILFKIFWLKLMITVFMQIVKIICVAKDVSNIPFCQ
jgi:hypothetical protein